MKTAELTGALLDYYVARAEGWRQVSDFGGPCWADSKGKIIYVSQYQPCADWAQGGPLIEKWRNHPEFEGMNWNIIFCCDTPLQAICRAVVRAAFGDAVEEVVV